MKPCTLRLIFQRTSLLWSLSLGAFFLLSAAPQVWSQANGPQSPIQSPAQNPVSNPVATPAPASPPDSSAVSAPNASVTAQGGVVHGTVKSGNIPLPGVSITATNTLTGQKFSTTTDVNGVFSMTIPANGRYVFKTDLAAFAPVTKELLLKPAGAAAVNLQADFALILASRVVEETAEPAGNLRRYAGAGTQSLDLAGALSGAAEAGTATGATGAALPSLANNSDFSNESVSVAGQAGTTNPFAGADMDQLRQNSELDESLSGTGGGEGGGRGGRSSGLGGGGGGGGFGGGPGRGGGGGGGGRGFGNFRNFKPNQPHGSFYWSGGNGALNAVPFPIGGEAGAQPSYAQNNFGLTFFGPPYIPHLLTHDTKDVLFFTGSGQRSSQPLNLYGTVPTADERNGDFSMATQNGNPVTIYDPKTGLPYPNDRILPGDIVPQATALLNFIPLPTIPGQTLNYRRVASAESNQTRIGLRFMHSFGSNPGGPMVGMIRQFLGQGGPGIRQSVNANFNYNHQSNDELNIFPQLSGKEQVHQYSLQLGYSLGKGRLTNNFSAGWNRSHTENTNLFTNTTDIADQIGLDGLPSNPSLFGLPNLTLPPFTGVNEQQPVFQTNQTITVADLGIWVHGKHNIRYGGDLRRVHFDLLGSTGTATGSYIFTGLFTQAPGSSGGGGTTNTGSALADMLLGLPQQTALQAPYQTAYLRENTWDAYAQDDWRARANLTFLVGLRYEYFSPYSEKDDRLSTLDTGNDFTSVATVLSNGIGPYTGKFPRDLIYPEHYDFSPRIGFAARVARDTVLRGGYAINYAVGQYSKFVQNFAFEPPYANVQTNNATAALDDISLADGFPVLPADQLGNYGVNKNYRLPYVQVWNLNLQRTLPGEIVMNIGYSGSKGTRLDIIDAPGRPADGLYNGPLYNYEDSVAFSNFNSLTVSARRRLHSGVSLQAAYTYAHSIDNASSVGGSGYAVTQNWQNLLAEESNSSFDIRHQVKGEYLYALPFGPDAHWVTTGWASQLLTGLSVSGTFTFATGEPLTPSYVANIGDVARGSIGSLRPDRVLNTSLTAGGGSLTNWFNKNAFATPADVYGSASRYSIPGPGTISNNMSLSKTMRFAATQTFEMRATADNIFNTVQYDGVNTSLGSASYGQVTSAAAMRQFTFNARYRF